MDTSRSANNSPLLDRSREYAFSYNSPGARGYTVKCQLSVLDTVERTYWNDMLTFNGSQPPESVEVHSEAPTRATVRPLDGDGHAEAPSAGDADDDPIAFYGSVPVEAIESYLHGLCVIERKPPA